MKVLVCAASKYGATSEIAQAVTDVLAERGCEVTVLPPQEVGPVEEFNAVVLGSAVYMGQWMKPARELAERQATTLADRPVWLFSSGPVGEPRQARRKPRRRHDDPAGHQRPRAPDLHRQASEEAPQLPRPCHGLSHPRRRGRLPQLGRHPRLGHQHRRHPACLNDRRLAPPGHPPNRALCAAGSRIPIQQVDIHSRRSACPGYE
jgi:hypothetical protein